MILVKIIEPKISTAVELWWKLQLKTKFFFRIIVGGESPWKHLPFIKSIWRLASPNALNRSNLMRVSALRLFSRWVFLSCIAERADMSTSASLCWSLYCLRLYNNPYITTSTRSLITLWSKYLRGHSIMTFTASIYWFLYHTIKNDFNTNTFSHESQSTIKEFLHLRITG